MPRTLSRKTREHLAKARECCLAAVAAYNNPGVHFRSGTYIVLIVIAWTSLLHAIFYRNRVQPWHVRSGSGRGTRYERVDGDYRHWELGECLRRHYGGQSSPVRENLRFLLGLRDRIEHRNMPELDHDVFGECQAALLNFETLLRDEFGAEHCVNTSLAFSLQFSGLLPDERVAAMRALRQSATDSVVEYVQRFRNELAPEIAYDQRFAFKVFLVPQLANHKATGTLAVEWLPADESDPQTLRTLDRAIVLVKQRHVPVRTLPRFLPRRVVEKVSKRIPWLFRMHEHTQCWRHLEVRPLGRADDPSACEQQYCQWDPTFGAHAYTEDWIDHLATELQDAARFEEIVGQPPRRKPG